MSFVANTNWRGYSGEQTMSYLTQMLGLAVQNFLSAATGIAVVIALIRGFARHSAQGIGNAWVDLTRVTLWILLPEGEHVARPVGRVLWASFDAGVSILAIGDLCTPAIPGEPLRISDEIGKARGVMALGHPAGGPFSSRWMKAT